MKKFISILILLSLSPYTISQKKLTERQIKKTLKNFVLKNNENFNGKDTIFFESNYLMKHLKCIDNFNFKVRDLVITICSERYIFFIGSAHYFKIESAKKDNANVDFIVYEQKRNPITRKKIGALKF